MIRSVEAGRNKAGGIGLSGWDSETPTTAAAARERDWRSDGAGHGRNCVRTVDGMYHIAARVGITKAEAVAGRVVGADAERHAVTDNGSGS